MPGSRVFVAAMNATTTSEAAAKPLTRDAAIEKYAKAAALRYTSPSAEWLAVFPDAASLVTFRAEVGDCAWPENMGQSPWDDAFSLACTLADCAGAWQIKLHGKDLASDTPHVRKTAEGFFSLLATYGLTIAIQENPEQEQQAGEAMKTSSLPAVTANHSQGLYVIPSGDGYSCLGFQVCIDRLTRLAAELGVPAVIGDLGSLANYHGLQLLQETARKAHERTGWRATCELSPQLTGLEGKRVEVVTAYGETRRFIVGRSTGWIPIHLEIKNRGSSGGVSAEREYKSVRVIR